MSELKKLSAEDLAHIKDCREEGYPDPDDDMSRVLAIRDVARLLDHIAAMEAELERMGGYAAFLRSCALSGEQPETYEWYLKQRANGAG